MDDPEVDRAYYYSGGQRVFVETAPEYCAIDLDEVRGSALHDALEVAAKMPSVSRRRDTIVARKDDLPSTVVAELLELNALQAVFKAGRTLLVFLPEVRLEIDADDSTASEKTVDKETLESERDEKLNAIQKWLNTELPFGAELTRYGRGAKVRPRSGKGIDALEMANELQEQFDLSLVQARMLRLTPRDLDDG